MREKIPNETALKKQLRDVIKSNLTDFIESTNSRRTELIGDKRYVLLSAFFIVAVVFELYFISINIETLYKNIILSATVVWVLVLLLSGRKWMTNTRLLAREMNLAMVPILTSTFDRMFMYTNANGRNGLIEQLLAESKLMTTTDIQVVSDDVYSAFGDGDVVFRDVAIEKHSTEPSAQTKQDALLFKGLFVVADLKKPFESELFISTKGGTDVFAHDTFWPQLLSHTTLHEVDSGNAAVHVAASDDEVAKAAITESFISDLLSWHTVLAKNIRISVRGDKMYLLIPDTTIKITTSTTSIKKDVIEPYAWSVALPIWRTLLLIDEMRN